MEKILTEMLKSTECNGTYLIKNTLNDPSTRTVCWNERPCHRIRVCKYCLNRRRKQITNQFVDLAKIWKFERFFTISFPGFHSSPPVALRWLSVLRTSLFHSLLRKKKYFSVIAIGFGDQHSITPHIHFVASALVTKKTIDEKLKKLVDQSQIRTTIHLQSIVQDDQNFRRVCGYMFDQNYRTTIQYSPKRTRLITSSRGLKIGFFRPSSKELKW